MRAVVVVSIFICLFGLQINAAEFTDEQGEFYGEENDPQVSLGLERSDAPGDYSGGYGSHYGAKGDYGKGKSNGHGNYGEDGEYVQAHGYLKEAPYEGGAAYGKGESYGHGNYDGVNYGTGGVSNGGSYGQSPNFGGDYVGASLSGVNSYKARGAGLIRSNSFGGRGSGRMNSGFIGGNSFGGRGSGRLNSGFIGDNSFGRRGSGRLNSGFIGGNSFGRRGSGRLSSGAFGLRGIGRRGSIRGQSGFRSATENVGSAHLTNYQTYESPVIPEPSYAYSYPSDAPRVPCGSNLLISCNPSSQIVPCSSYLSYPASQYEDPSY